MGAFPKRARGRLKETLDHVVQLFPILGQRRDQPAGTLSGGEQQMLAIGRALMSRPRLLLVDELSLGLAPVITQSIYRTLSALGSDITILLVEQNVEQALNFSRRAFILESGRITRSGRSSVLLQDADIRRAYLGLQHSRPPVAAEPDTHPTAVGFRRPSKIFQLSKPIFTYRMKCVECLPIGAEWIGSPTRKSRLWPAQR
jgi:ABC-type multidrug transport system ATPase subunit